MERHEIDAKLRQIVKQEYEKAYKEVEERREKWEQGSQVAPASQ